MSLAGESFVDVAGIPTQLLKCGDIDQRNTLILVIPGNPGVPGFYQEFITSMRAACGSIPVWIMSHAGHVTVPEDMQHISKKRTYDLVDQVNHKRAFIEEFVPLSCRLVLIGHSIGSYVILRLLAEHQHANGYHQQQDGTSNVASRIVLRAVLLFPTIERMHGSPSGRYVGPLAIYGRWLVSAVIRLASYAPASWRLALIKWNLCGATEAAILPAARMVADVCCVNNIMTMTRHEMYEVLDAEHEVIEANIGLLSFYYGRTDGWCPVHYHDDMIARHPTADIRLCEHGIEHAFVLRSSKQMADIVSEWIEKYITSHNYNTSEKDD